MGSPESCWLIIQHNPRTALIIAWRFLTIFWHGGKMAAFCLRNFCKGKGNSRRASNAFLRVFKPWKKGSTKLKPKKERERNEKVTSNFNRPDGVSRHRDINGQSANV
jgi:hypothetical protein